MFTEWTTTLWARSHELCTHYRRVITTVLQPHIELGRPRWFTVAHHVYISAYTSLRRVCIPFPVQPKARKLTSRHLSVVIIPMHVWRVGTLWRCEQLAESNDLLALGVWGPRHPAAVQAVGHRVRELGPRDLLERLGVQHQRVGRSVLGAHHRNRNACQSVVFQTC